MKNNQITLAPPPAKTLNHQFKIIRLLSVVFVLFFSVCNGADENTHNSNPNTPNTPKYTTTVSGKVITPARAADPTKGGVITTAQVWASTDLTKKVSVDTTDGSYSLEVAGHSGTFTITADYTAGDGNYKAGAPQSVSTTAAAHTQNIALKYGYTITISGRIADDQRSTGGSLAFGSGATLTAAVEGRVVESVTADNMGDYRISFDHPGTFQLRASLGTPPNGRSDVFEQLTRNTNPTMNERNFLMIP